MSLVRRLFGSVLRTGSASTFGDAQAEVEARRLASAAINALDVAQARAHLVPVIGHATNPETYCMYARLLLVDGNAQAALETLQSAEVLDDNHPTVLDELATLYLHVGDPVRELEMRKRRLLCGSSLTSTHVLAAARVIAQVGRRSPSLVQDVKLATALFRRFEPIAHQAEKLEFAEYLYSIDGVQREARARLEACLPAQAGEQRVELRLRAGAEFLDPGAVVSSPGDRLLQALVLEQAAILPGAQWCPWLPESKVALRGFFTRRLRTAREDPPSQLLLHSGSHIVASVPAQASRAVPATGVLIGGQDNYYHFIAEHLSRLATLDALGLPTEDALLIVPVQLPQFARDLLHLAGYPDERLMHVGRQDSLVFDRLIAPLPPVRGGAEISPAVSAWFRRTFARYMVASEPLKLYVSRARASRRGITNEQEVVEYLRNEGFQVVYPEELNVRQQIALYSRAQEVVAPGGAALTNMVFMPAGSRTTMINNRHLPQEAQKLFFEPLARSCGVRFQIVSGTPRKFTTNRVLDADVEVSIDELHSSLSSS